MKLVKFLLAWLLLPLLWSGGEMLVWLMKISLAGEVPWASVAWFVGGFSLCTAVYLIFSLPNSLYIFGHEATHALAVWVSGGKISQFKVGRDSGHVIADRTSTWISLAPYLVPLYPLATGTFWALSLWIVPELNHWMGPFLFFWGMVWAFHLCFTFNLMRSEQTDLSHNGYFFSWVLIVLTHLWMLVFILWAWLHPIHLWELVARSGTQSLDAYRWCFEQVKGLF